MKCSGLPLLCAVLWATSAIPSVQGFALLASPLALGHRPIVSSLPPSASASLVSQTAWTNVRSSFPPLFLADTSPSLTDVPLDASLTDLPLEAATTTVPVDATLTAANAAVLPTPVAATAISPAVSLDPSPTMATTLSSAADTVAQATDDLDPENLGLVAASLVFLFKAIHSALNSLGMHHNSWGTSIILLTLCIKLLTSPLSYFQISTNQRMRALQPHVNRFKEMYKDNKVMVAKLTNQLYSKNSVYPMALAVPSLIQIPVLIGLYRAISTMSSQSALDEPFFFLPTLVGPPVDLLKQHWHNGSPDIGWHQYLSYLALPVLVSAVQFLSQTMMTSYMSGGPDDQQSPSPIPKGFLQYLSPLTMSYMSLRFPPALSIYWVSNSAITAGLNYLMSNHRDVRVVDLDGNESVTPVSQLPQLITPPGQQQAPPKPFVGPNKKPKKKKKRPILQEG
eukprot:Nitzschia sp. Nitz4//scaffold58_size112336//9895//11473//NITZ4_004015-RA/size112336-augustus-gene-0.1-mRNA-1//1//CDS//3329554935//4297//frame0